MVLALLESDDDNIPDVVPFFGGHGGSGTPTWTAALPLIANWVFEYFDDDAAGDTLDTERLGPGDFEEPPSDDDDGL